MGGASQGAVPRSAASEDADPSVDRRGFGGIDGYSKAHIRYLDRKVKDHGAADRTVYGRHRGSTRSFYVHHMQQISKAAVTHDARAIRVQIGCLKQRALERAGQPPPAVRRKRASC